MGVDAFLPHSGAQGLEITRRKGFVHRHSHRLTKIYTIMYTRLKRGSSFSAHCPICFFLFLQCIILSLPLPDGIPHPPFLSVSPLCVQYDYVTKQKSPTRMFIGGAHLWLVLHNRSLLISALTYLECKINTV